MHKTASDYIDTNRLNGDKPVNYDKIINLLDKIQPGEEEKTLQVLLDCGMINEEEKTLAQEIQNMRKREELLQKHPYKIWEKDGTYYTWLPDKTRKDGRRQVKRRNKKNLEEEIIKSVKAGMVITIDDLFREYIERKSSND